MEKIGNSERGTILKWMTALVDTKRGCGQRHPFETRRPHLRFVDSAPDLVVRLRSVVPTI